MISEIITPDYVIELNQDYTISNHGIHKEFCSYYRKRLSNLRLNSSSQSGGFIRDNSMFTKIAEKYFYTKCIKIFRKVQFSSK